jgi:hypothetical protein
MTLAMTSLISAATPTGIIFFVLFISGLARSLQFTALNTLSFADVPKSQLSAATSFSSTIQQLSVGIGVAVGAMSLQLARWISGHGPDAMAAGDFQMAFLFVAIIGLVGVVDVFGLSRDAGAVVSGHRTAGNIMRGGRP